MIFLRGTQLTAMYRPCYMNAQAAVTRKRLSGPLAKGANAGMAKAHVAADAKGLGHLPQ
jgi:hypothetical protein